MSSLGDKRPHDFPMKVLIVGKPCITSFDSFEEGARDTSTQARMKQAKREWEVTDKLSVLDYSYWANTLRLHLGPLTLEIIADGPVVKWHLSNSLPALGKSEPPYILVQPDYGNREQVFDRDAVLAPIIGQNIRPAPSANEVYLLWKHDHEIGTYSLPLLNENGWLLYYE